MFDAVIVGSGPNGLTAAALLARSGLDVCVYECADTIGGGARTTELTLPGFRHDVCSAVHPFAAGSPVLRGLPLEDHGLGWLRPEIAVAHPLDDGSAGVLRPDLAQTTGAMGADARRYDRLLGPFVERWDDVARDVLSPLFHWPRAPALFARFGLRAVLPASALGSWFSDERARGLFAGLAAHGMAPFGTPFTSAVAVMLALSAHAHNWPIARGGSQAISDALASLLTEAGGRIETGVRVQRLEELPPSRAYVFDVMPADLASIAGDSLPSGYRRRLRSYRHGPAVFKLDYALSGPVPWRNEECRRAGTVHVGGAFDEVAAALRDCSDGRAPERPFVITSQPSVLDPSRAPDGRHTFWAYAHVPNGWAGDLTEAVERQLERFAPGFRDLVLARATAGPPELAAYNPNYVGGDIGGGAITGLQAVLRPVIARVPYATPNPSIYLCSAATPPGAGVHGMCGYHAARAVLTRTFGARPERGPQE